MVKFCANCGLPLDEADKVCGNCGTPVVGMPAVKTDIPTSAAKPAKSKGNTAIVILVGVLIAFIAMLVIGMKVASNFTGYKGTVRSMVKALQNYDMETLNSLTSPTSDEIYGCIYGDDLYDGYQEIVSDTLDKYEDNVGNIKRITYEISDVTELSDRRVEEAKDNLVMLSNIDASSIKKILKVDLALTVKGSKKTASYNVSKLYLFKENGSWKLYYGDLSY